jgi:hypothetical protein
MMLVSISRSMEGMAASRTMEGTAPCLSIASFSAS